ncbi:YjbF family lipoprotein [Parashewanella tropica]|uniref:YjbF family lipoprotein n=1 Tax=Parashewanella tropica TaxID=2547970 RepID=UPI00105A601A|nr:YjbF family lipoprotein [Parashewanella tropica]
MRFLSVLVLSTLFLSGCSNNTQHFTDTFKLAVFGKEQTKIDHAKVVASPYASLYVKQGENPAALMVLAWAEEGHTKGHPALKWLSSSKEMLMTESGRITKTLKLPNENLVSVHSNKPDPLSLGLHLDSTPRFWRYQISWQPGYHFAYQAESRFILKGKVIKQLPSGLKETLHVIEKVSVPKLSLSYNNDYWIAPKTGEVIASSQIPAPGMQRFELTIGKSFGG